MSFPPDKTYFNQVMNKIPPKPLIVNNGIPTIHYYIKEIKYLEEEISYWTTEYQLNPTETKLDKIGKLTTELENIRNTYERLQNEGR